MTTAFTSTALSAPLLKALDVLKFTEMTPVQAHTLPALLDERDVIGQARTGSGKTVAFGLGVLSQIDARKEDVQALILCPTRELADQVTAEIRRLARFIPNVKVVTLCGGIPVRTQTPSLTPPPHIVVGTPGRIMDHLRRRTLYLGELRVFVLDEADRMLDMGFSEDIETIATQLPGERQTLLFSATFPHNIRRLSGELQKEPVEVKVDTERAIGEIEQVFFAIKRERKIDAVGALLDDYRPESALIFCETKKDTNEVARELHARGHSVLALHGDMEQRDRDEALVRFANKSCRLLVATDVAARGLDVKSLSAVISYELPHDHDVHTHRIGRTARAGATGLALALCDPREKPRAVAIEKAQPGKLHWGWVDIDSAPLPPPPAAMVTLVIAAGKKDKLRPGDLLGALTGDVGLSGDVIGKITIQARRTYVAVARDHAEAALNGLKKNKIKGRVFRVRRMS